jgi:hypothetical protein
MFVVSKMLNASEFFLCAWISPIWLMFLGVDLFDCILQGSLNSCITEFFKINFRKISSSYFLKYSLFLCLKSSLCTCWNAWCWCCPSYLRLINFHIAFSLLSWILSVDGFSSLLILFLFSFSPAQIYLTRLAIFKISDIFFHL